MLNFKSYEASWRESFAFLKKDIGLLLLVSLRTLLSLYRSLLHAWYLPIALLVGLVLDIRLLLGSFYLVLLVRAARPSIDEKNSPYWQQIVFADWVVFFGTLLFIEVWEGLPYREAHSFLSMVLAYTYDFLLRVCFVSKRLWLPGTESLGTMSIFLSPLIIIITLFMLDAQKTVWSYVKAVGRGFLMFFYNYPFFIITYALLRLMLAAGYLLSIHLSWYFPQCGIAGWFLFLFVVFPYWICVMTNFYVKRLHEQFSDYYATRA